MLTIIMCIEYDGTDYCGWQIQLNKKTIQGELTKAIKKATGNEYTPIGAGRTDTGVHSTGQIAHFQFDENQLKLPKNKIILAINQKLPKNIRVKKLWITDLEFHSRYDAVMREYRYRFSRRPSVFHQRFTTFFPYKMDLDLLFKSAEIFIGKHNFYSFSKSNSSNENYICDVKKCIWQQTDEFGFELSVIADRYVYGMVRAIVGAMIDIARNKRKFEDIVNTLQSQNRTLASPFAPPVGLDLFRIYYKSPFDFVQP